MKKQKTIICCPKCGKSHYEKLESISTLIYYPPIYKNGININEDKNKITTTFHCLTCGNNWNIVK